MITSVRCGALSNALEELKEIVRKNEEGGLKTVIFCEDRLSLAAERTVCAAVGGVFNTSVYTFSRFLSAECGKPSNLLSAQGSAMAVRKIIEQNRQNLTLFKRLSAPSAAQAVYDAISMLYASRVSWEDVEKAALSGLLGGKLKDVALIYREYLLYLRQNGLEDRNGYLKRLGPVVERSKKIKGASVVFLGFQALTAVTEECIRSAFISARDVYGLFIGGDEEIYVNEATAGFFALAREFGGAQTVYKTGSAREEPEIFKKRLFDPESFYKPPYKTGRVRILEGADEDEELEFIAANIKRHVIEYGERYGKISVMLPDLKNCQKKLARVFSEYGIPYFADRRISLFEHPLTSFIINWLLCLTSGCRQADVDVIVASPYFAAEREDKNQFRNYLLRLGNFRGGVKREPDKTITENAGFNYESVIRVRAAFLKGYNALSSGDVFAGLYNLLEIYKVREKLNTVAQNRADDYPAAAAFGARAYDGVLSVLHEAEGLCKELPLRDIIKILKSGFTAAEISIIPPKADAVFVGDVTATANTGSNVVFAARLTEDVPDVSGDTSILTDRDVAALEKVNLNVSPKIRQVNLRKRETAALNLCAFREYLYLSYPARLGGEEKSPSEIIAYASAAFCTASGERLSKTPISKIEGTVRMLPYFASEKLPALKQLVKRKGEAAGSAIYAALKENGLEREAQAAKRERVRGGISCGRKLYFSYDSISPTALETYFTCPYLAFMRQGLRVKEREEGLIRPLDTGNFVHKVLELTAPCINDADDLNAFKELVLKKAEELLNSPQYCSLLQVKSGKFIAERLKENAVRIAAGMYEQIKNSRFKVAKAEYKCQIPLPGGIKLFGKIDRVDETDDMVRVIDYKTGKIDASAAKYYTGEKLQLPLYLFAAAAESGKKAAGAYYFPASVEFSDSVDGVFRLSGFMDGSAEVVSASDVTCEEGCKSKYVHAYLNGRKTDGALTGGFDDFLQYGILIAGKGAEEMLSGNVTPSPAGEACEFCKMGGSCGFSRAESSPRKAPTIKCAQIAALNKEDNDG